MLLTYSCITNCHKLSGFNNQHLCLQFLWVVIGAQLSWNLSQAAPIRDLAGTEVLSEARMGKDPNPSSFT